MVDLIAGRITSFSFRGQSVMFFTGLDEDVIQSIIATGRFYEEE